MTDYTHDADGNVLSITVTGGGKSRSWTFTYNSNGQPLTINGPRTDVNDLTTLEYYDCTTGNECGQLEKVTNALGHVNVYDTYDGAGRLTQMTDPNGLQTSFTYDSRGRLLTGTQTPLAGTPRVTTMTYDDAGQLATVTAPDGAVLTYFYNAAHYLTSVTDNLGNSITYDYDAMGNLTDEDTYDPSSTLARTLNYAHDLNDRLDTVTNGGFTTDIATDLVGNLTAETDPNSNLTQHTYDVLNRLDTTIDALTGIVDYNYDNHDNLTQVVAANGATTSYVYDNLDNLQSESSPDRGLTTYSYDDAGNRLTTIDARGILTTFSYDALNRLTQVSLDGGGTIDYEYDVGTNAKGRLNRITDASGNTAWSYDNFGAVTNKSQTVGSVVLTTQYAYDAQGRMTAMTLPSGKVVNYGFNTYEPESVSVSGTTLLSGASSEPFGPVSGWNWGDGSTHSRNYDLRGLLTEQSLALETRTLDYDDAGRLTSITDGQIGRDMSYDELNRLTSFLTGNPSNSSNPWLALAEVNAPNAVYLQSETVTSTQGFIWTPTMPTTSGTYEFRLFQAGGFNRLATSAPITVQAMSSPPPPIISLSGNFAYGGDPITATLAGGPGNTYDWLALAPAGSGDSSYSAWVYVGATSAVWQVNMPTTPGNYEIRLFENNGYTRLATSQTITVSELIPASSATIEVSETEVAGGSPITVTMTGGPGNASDWLGIFPAGSSNYSYLSYIYVGAGQTSATWNTTVPTSPGKYDFRLLANGGYTRLATSEIVWVPAMDPPSIEVSATSVFSGETVATVTSNVPDVVSTSALASQAFQYDANGNRISLTEGGLSYSYTNEAGGNRLLSTVGPTAKVYAYDASGNVTSDGVHTYSYDDRGRLVTVDVAAASYQHNGQGQRVKKTVGTTTVLFAYDEMGNLIGEYDSIGNTVREHVWFAGAPVAVLAGTDTHYVHTDHLGTPRAITDAGTVIWSWESDAYGSSAANEDPDGDSTLFTYNLRFPGQYYDVETGFHYNYYRTYDPSTGRYLESDPIGLAAGPNTYSYVENMPTMRIDPLGLFGLAGHSQARMQQHRRNGGRSSNATGSIEFSGGAFGHGAVVGLGANAGVSAKDGKVCVFVELCGSFGLGVFGTAGGQVGAGLDFGGGSARSGMSINTGFFYGGGAGGAAMYTFTAEEQNRNANLNSAGSVRGGIGGGGAAGIISCRRLTWCPNPADPQCGQGDSK